jgi:hypothetical protein
VFGADSLGAREIRLNKATAHSWLVFAARGQRLQVDFADFDAFLHWVELARLGSRHPAHPTAESSSDPVNLVLSLFNDRATSRVNDVSSVLIRDAALWALASERSERVVKRASNRNEAEEALLRRVSEIGWARLP